MGDILPTFYQVLYTERSRLAILGKWDFGVSADFAKSPQVRLQAEDNTTKQTVDETVGDGLQGAEEPMETSNATILIPQDLFLR